MECTGDSYSVEEYTHFHIVYAQSVERSLPFFSMMELAKGSQYNSSNEPLLMYIFMSSSWNIVEQLLRCDRQGFGELDDILERDVPFPALHSADIVPVESCPFCKFLLRQAPFDAKRSHRASEPRFHRLRGHLSSFRADHYESTHDECYLFW